jgi:hypothetical protein
MHCRILFYTLTSSAHALPSSARCYLTLKLAPTDYKQRPVTSLGCSSPGSLLRCKASQLFPCQHSKPQNGALRKPHSRTLSKRYFSTRSRPTKGCPRGGAFGQGVSTTDRFLSRDKIKVYLRSADCPGIFYTYTFLFCCLDFAHLCKHFTCRCAQRA